MQINGNYKYVISLSRESYINKEISGACIGTTKDPKNREIRKKYGLPCNKGISYEQIIGITPEQHLKKMISGHVMCNLFTPDKSRKDGSFGSTQKVDANFFGTFTIGVDIDETSYTSITDYIDKLSLKPTFYYSSYSHLQKNDDGTSKGCRFRMVYVLDQDSYIDDPYKFRYIANRLNKIIERDTKELIHDNCNIRCSQYFNGTNINNPDLNVEYGLTNIIYNINDFGVSVDGYVNFLENFAEYKSRTKEKKADILAKLKEATGEDYIWDKTSGKFIIPSTITSTDPSINTSYPDTVDPNNANVSVVDYCELSERIFNDWDKIKECDFKKQADWEYQRRNCKYIYRVEPDYWYKDKWQLAGDNYFKLYYYSVKLKDGQQRRKTLYQRICLRRVIKNDITKDEMLVNALIDVMRFFDNTDFCLNSTIIRELIDNAFLLTIDDIKKELKEQIDWLKENTRPAKGIIYKEASDYTQETIFEILDELYDQSKSVAENLSILNDSYGFLIKKTSLYDYLKNRNIKTIGKATDEELMAIIDPSLSSRKNLEIIKAKGIKAKLERVQKLLKLMKEVKA